MYTYAYTLICIYIYVWRSKGRSPCWSRSRTPKERRRLASSLTCHHYYACHYCIINDSCTCVYIYIYIHTHAHVCICYY